MGKSNFDVEDDYDEGPSFSSFFIGLIMFCVGCYLIFQNTTIYTSFNLGGMLGFNPPFGLVLLPLLIGIIILFYKDTSFLGWFLIIFGVISILLGILFGLRISFRPVSLYYTILMYGLTAAGMGVTLRGLIGKRRSRRK
ncbi:hypothetical protein SAMN02745163_02419 [Clostridium cavendishii DSM 21758]|uniref:Uncharacterized protein n=1 Tax=Clostridium cavendishii DSM 21758 TaxID=1121302 RepID=A0A1M6LLI0_9CLOT|nr:hypothetical protein [Clostridium cavendishii]SHJ72010.1 hypothetical protein SAMN02745163_02419 [Clostridium cavendishii DSM 21758]